MKGVTQTSRNINRALEGPYCITQADKSTGMTPVTRSGVQHKNLFLNGRHGPNSSMTEQPLYRTLLHCRTALLRLVQRQGHGMTLGEAEVDGVTDGVTEAEAEPVGVIEADADIVGVTDADGDADGLIDGVTDTDGETDGEEDVDGEADGGRGSQH